MSDGRRTLSLPDIEDGIAIVRNNIRHLAEQAAATSGAGDEARNADRLAEAGRVPPHAREHVLPRFGRERAAFPHLTVIASPLRSALTMAPTEEPVSDSIAPFWLVSTIACAPRPTAAPTLPAA